MTVSPCPSLRHGWVYTFLPPPKEVCFTCRLSVCPFFCLSVCCQLHVTTTDLRETSTKDVWSVDNEELNIFWKSPHSRIRIRIQKFLKDFWHCEIGHFFPLFGSCLWNNWWDVHENFISDLSLDNEVPVKVWQSSGFGVRTLDSNRIRSLAVYTLRVLVRLQFINVCAV